MNPGAAVDIRVKETPDWLTIDKSGFKPALDNVGVRKQELMFEVDGSVEVAGFEMTFNPRNTIKKKGSIVYNATNDAFEAEGSHGQAPWFEVQESSEITETEGGGTRIDVDFTLTATAYSRHSQFENWIYYRVLDSTGAAIGATGANPEGWFLWPLDFDVLPLTNTLGVQFETDQGPANYNHAPIANPDAAILVSVRSLPNHASNRKYRLSHNWLDVPLPQEIELTTAGIAIDYGDGSAPDSGEPHRYAYPDGYTIAGTLTFSESGGEDWVIPTATVFLKFAGDTDGDGIPNYNDPDNDNDGFCDLAESVDGACQSAVVCTDENDPETCEDVPDAFPLDEYQWTDRDGDGFGDSWDGCGDHGSNPPPTESCRGDDFPDDPNENRDVDADGIGDNADPDDDNDGLTDVYELEIGTHPELRDSDFDYLRDDVELALMGEALAKADSDGDGLINILDRDSDDDGLVDGDEEASTSDYDNDGKIALVDADSDNDGVLDGDDSVPVGWPSAAGLGGFAGLGASGGGTGGDSVVINQWRNDLPAGFIKTDVTFYAYGMHGEASRLEHDTEWCLSKCLARCLVSGDDDDADWVINKSTSSVYVSNSNMSHSNIKAAFEEQLEGTEWELEGDIELRDLQLDGTSTMSWGGTSGCHPNEFKIRVRPQLLQVPGDPSQQGLRVI